MIFGWTLTYTISQILALIGKVLLILTFFLKSRKKIIWANTGNIIFSASSFYLLNAYSGMASGIIAAIRNVFAYTSDINSKSKTMLKREKITMYVVMIALLIAGIFTYQGIGSTLYIIATMLVTYSICQKSVLRYKLLGVIVSILRLLYYIYIWSIVAIWFEVGFLIFAIWGAGMALKNNLKSA